MTVDRTERPHASSDLLERHFAADQGTPVTNTYHLYVRYRLGADILEDDSAWALLPLDSDTAVAGDWDRLNNLRDHGDTSYRWIDLTSNATAGLDLVGAYTNVAVGNHTWWFGGRENGFYADAFVFSTGFDLDLTAAGQAHLDAVINDRPVITTTVGALSYTEGAGAQLIDGGLTVTDPDDGSLASATVAISTGYVSAQDALGFTNQNGISGSWDAATGVLTLTGTASVAHYQTAIRSVTYTNSGDAPTTSRTITISANDGDVDSSPATRAISITAVNDAPMNTVPGAQSTPANTARIFSTANGNRISTADVDAGSSPVRAQLTATNGTLTLAGTTGLTFSAGDGTADASMTFTGTISAVNTTLDGSSFSPTTGFAGTASVQIVINDQGNTGSGGALSDTDSVSVLVAGPPTAVNDTYVATQDTALVVPASGVLANDTDPLSLPLTVASPRPVSGPSNGSLALEADGSFTYTPNQGFDGVDSFTYKATNGTAESGAATVTIMVNDGYLSSAGWPIAFAADRYLDLTFPPYVTAGSVVTGATFRHSYRSAFAGDTTCYYFGVYKGTTLLATHGTAGSPVSCNGTTAHVTDEVDLPEVDTVAEANELTVRLYVRNSGGRQSAHVLATVDVASHLDVATQPQVQSTITESSAPYWVAANETTNRIYVTNSSANTVAVIDGATDAVIQTVAVGTTPYGVAVDATRNRIYVANSASDTVSVIDGTTNTVIATVTVGDKPLGIAVNETTNTIYVTNQLGISLSVISGATNTVTATVGTGATPQWVAVNETTNRIYVAVSPWASLLVLNGATNGFVAGSARGSPRSASRSTR